MSEFGFSRAKSPSGRTHDESERPKTLDVSGLKTQPIRIDPVREREAVTRGEDLGFVDRGQGGVVRRNRKAQPSATVFIKGPVDTIQWFIRYTEDRGYPAYWNALQDLRDMVEGVQKDSPDVPDGSIKP